MKKSSTKGRNGSSWLGKDFLSGKGVVDQLAILKKVLAENLRLWFRYLLPIAIIVALSFVFGRYYFDWLASWLALPMSIGGVGIDGRTGLALAAVVCLFLIGAVMLVRTLGGLGRSMVDKKGNSETILEMTNLSSRRTVNLLSYVLFLIFIWLLPYFVMAAFTMVADNNLNEIVRFLVYGHVLSTTNAWKWLNLPWFNIVLFAGAFALLADLLLRAFMAPIFIARDGATINTAIKKARQASPGVSVVFLLIYVLVLAIISLIFLSVSSLGFANYSAWSGSLWLVVVGTVVSTMSFVILAAAVLNTAAKKQTAVQTSDSLVFKIALWLVVLPVIVSWTAFAFLHQSVSDVTEMNDADMAVARTDVPVEENAYLLPYKEYGRLGASMFNQINASESFAGQTKVDLEEWATGKTWDQSKIDLALNKGELELAAYDKAKTLPYYQVPIKQFYNHDFGPTGNPVLLLGRLAAIRGRNMLVKNDWQGAEKEALGLLAFSQLLNKSKTNSFANFNLSLQLADSYAWPLLNSVLDSGKLKTKDLIALAEVLPGEEQSFGAAAMGQYQLSKAKIRYAADNEFRSEQYFLLPDFCALEISQLSKSLVKMSKLNAIHMDSFYAAALDGYGEPRFLTDFFKKNSQCNHFLADYLMLANEANIKRMKSDWSRGATVIRVAIMRYQLANNKWPESLSVLAPKYLTVLPLDPYKLGPVLFNADKGYVYVTGRNLHDEQGGFDDQRFFYRKTAPVTVAK
ncbi:MAG: hypothetical protein WCO55_01785 [Candidatus Falkowbacteria bacterium]